MSLSLSSISFATVFGLRDLGSGAFDVEKMRSAIPKITERFEPAEAVDHTLLWRLPDGAGSTMVASATVPGCGRELDTGNGC